MCFIRNSMRLRQVSVRKLKSSSGQRPESPKKWSAAFPERLGGQNPSEVQFHIYFPHLRRRAARPRGIRAVRSFLLHVPASPGAISIGRTRDHERVRLVLENSSRQFCRADYFSSSTREEFLDARSPDSFEISNLGIGSVSGHRVKQPIDR